MENSRARAFSSPDLVPASTSHADKQAEDYSFEGIATNVKLLLKLIQEHNEASYKTNDDRRIQRYAGMITILDDVKSRIEKSQSSRKRIAQLRRCNTDLRPNLPPKDKKSPEQMAEENEKLRKQLSASMAARKSLEIMISSLGKEKEIMATQLARKNGEVSEMEELVNGLKAQNEKLLRKLQNCAEEQKKSSGGGGGEAPGNAALQDRNKALSDQLLRSLDRYRSLKRKCKNAKEETTEVTQAIGEIAVEIAAGLEQVRSFRQGLDKSTDQPVNIEEDVSALEEMFERLSLKVSKYEKKITECAKPKAEINADKASVLA